MTVRFYITTLGCPKNQADTREMERSLISSGYAPSGSAEEADFHLINSCAFIHAAREETIATVLDAAQIKRTKPGQKLILAGCFSQRYEKEIRDDLPEVDLSFGTGLYDRTGAILSEHFGSPVSILKSTEIPSALAGVLRSAGRPYAPVKIAEGCNRTCAFCAIPSFRGKGRDISTQEILEECRSLAAEGVREVCLVSQDTNSYGKKVEDLSDLVSRIEEIDGIEWIRLLYLYPDEKTRKLIGLLKNRAKLAPYLESPIQHASRKMLRAMNRAGSYESFQDLFSYARAEIPGLEIRTSILVGFPGETEDDIEVCARFIQETKPEKLALFSYSPEEGTSAFALKSSVSSREAARRVNFLREEHLKVLSEIHRARVGKTYRCLVDEIQGDSILARRFQDAPEVDEAVFLPKDLKVKAGDILDVEITSFFEYDMTGVPAEKKS